MCSTIWADQFCYPGNTLGFRPPPILKAFLATFGVLFNLVPRTFTLALGVLRSCDQPIPGPFPAPPPSQGKGPGNEVGVPLSYLPMVPHIHDPTSIFCQLEFLALFNVFWAESHLHIEIKWVGTDIERVAMGTKCFITVGLAYGGWARSTCGSQKLGILPKRHENSLFLRR